MKVLKYLTLLSLVAAIIILSEQKLMRQFYAESIPPVVTAKTKRIDSANLWTVDSSIKFTTVMIRTMHLEDSAKYIYILYAQGTKSYKDYCRAHDVYTRYFREVYVPMGDRCHNSLKHDSL
jgi:hypothetical protein